MLRMLAALLLFLEPLHFAAEALAVLPTIAYRGLTAVIELVVHGILAAVCAAAGLALWNASPDASRLATIAVIVAVGRVVQSLYWSVLPNNTRPGDEPIVAAVAIAAGVIVLLVLRRPSRGPASP